MDMKRKILNQSATILMVLALLSAALVFPQDRALAVGNTTLYHYSDVDNAFSVNNFNAAGIDYAEGETIPHAVMITGLTVGTQYGMWINFWRDKPPACGFTDVVQYDTTPRLSPINLLAGSTPITANGDLSTANGGLGGSLYTNGVTAGTVTVGAAQDSGVDRFIPVSFTASASTVYIYYGLRLAQDGNCGTGSTGASTFAGGSLEARIADVNGSNQPVPGILAANMITKDGPVKINPSGIIRSSFGGRKWNDTNNNQTMDAGEPGLAGWTIKIYNCGVSALCTTPTLLSTLTTDATGTFALTGSAIVGNYYKVCEVQQANWINTMPVPGGNVAGTEYCFAARQAASNVTMISNFGNWSPADLSVSKTHGVVPTSIYEPFKYTLVVTNNGYNGNAINFLSTFTLTDVLPAYLKIVNSPAPAANLTVTGGGGGSCGTVPYDVYGATLTCTLNALNYLGQVTIEFWVLQDLNAEIDTIVNTATIANYANGTCPAPNLFGSQVEMNCPNNTFTDTIQLGDPTSLTVSSPTASALDHSIQVDWLTSSELDILGFNLYRSTALNGPQALVYQVQAKHPGKPWGDSYGYNDTNAQPGVTYFYWLEVLWKDGSTELLDPASGTVWLKFFLPAIQR